MHLIPLSTKVYRKLVILWSHIWSRLKMTTKRLLEQPRASDSTSTREPVIGKALHEGAFRNFGKEISPNGHYYTSAREMHYIHKKVSGAYSSFAYIHLLIWQFVAFINKSKRLSAIMMEFYDGSSAFRFKLKFAWKDCLWSKCNLILSLPLYWRRR